MSSVGELHAAREGISRPKDVSIAGDRSVELICGDMICDRMRSTCSVTWQWNVLIRQAGGMKMRQWGWQPWDAWVQEYLLSNRE